MPKYIDSDKLMETIKAHDYLLVAHNNSIDRGMFTAGIQQVIDESPAADVIPAKRGEWTSECDDVHCYYEHTCSICGKKIQGSKPAHWNYCPNCGAKMEENQHD